MNNWFKELKKQVENDNIVWRRSRNYEIAKASFDYISDVLNKVDEQEEDEGLWFLAKTSPELYFQQELRRLHSVIKSGVEL